MNLLELDNLKDIKYMEDIFDINNKDNKIDKNIKNCENKNNENNKDINDNKDNNDNKDDNENKDKNQETSHSEKIDELMKAVAVGSISGYIGSFLEDVVTNLVNNEDEILKIISPTTEYAVDIISGIVLEIFADKLNLAQEAVLSTALFYGLNQGIAIYLNRDPLTDKELADDFLIDIVVVLGLSVLIDKFLKIFNITIDKDADVFSQIIFEIVTGIPYTIYYGARDFIFSRFTNNENQKKEDKEKTNEEIKNEKMKKGVVEKDK